MLVQIPGKISAILSTKTSLRVTKMVVDITATNWEKRNTDSEFYCFLTEASMRVTGQTIS